MKKILSLHFITLRMTGYSVLFGLFYRDRKPVSNELELIYSGIQHFPHEKYVFALRAIAGLDICPKII
nr:hypothetical protein [uncultured Draconibacterium sp.]